MTISKIVVASLAAVFSFIKILIFPQRVFYIFHIMFMELKGRYVSPYDKAYAFNTWISLSDFIESFLFTVLFYYIFLTLRGSDRKKEITKLSLSIVIIYYPVLLILNYFILGKNSLMGIMPVLFSSVFLLFLTIYFKFGAR